GLDRARLQAEGHDPASAMREASAWIASVAEGAEPVLVAYPLSFDWTWLYWYFIHFTQHSPFGHSRCLDIKTLYATKARTCIAGGGLAVEARFASGHFFFPFLSRELAFLAFSRFLTSVTAS